MSELARRYARGAAAAAAKADPKTGVEKLAEAIAVFAAAYRQSSELQQLIKNPAFTGQRQNVLQELCTTLRMDELAIRLVRKLGENERLHVLGELAVELKAISDENAGRRRARVVSAVPLSDEQEKRIAAALESRLGMPVTLESEIDPNVLGGFVCHVGAYTIDSSVRRQIQLVGERLSKTPSP